MSTLKHQDNLVLRTYVMPKDLNYNGTLFGGVMLSWIDEAGAIAAVRRANSRVALLKVTDTLFPKPALPGDIISFYAKVSRVGKTSLDVTLEIWRENIFNKEDEQNVAATATCTYVALDNDMKPHPVDR